MSMFSQPGFLGFEQDPNYVPPPVDLPIVTTPPVELTPISPPPVEFTPSVLNMPIVRKLRPRDVWKPKKNKKGKRLQPTGTAQSTLVYAGNTTPPFAPATAPSAPPATYAAETAAEVARILAQQQASEAAARAAKDSTGGGSFDVSEKGVTLGGNFTLSPTMLLLIGGGLFLLFRQPPGSGRRS